MNRYAFAVLLFFCGAHAWADSQAVRAPNYVVGYTSGDTYTSGGLDSSTYGPNAQGNFPLISYLGASLNGTYGRTSVTNPTPTTVTTGIPTPGTSSPSCIITNTSLGAGLFLRDPSMGRVGVSYDKGHTNSRCNATFIPTGSQTLDTTTQGANAEYYFRNFTLGATWSHTQIKPSGDLYGDSLIGTWYPMENLRASASASGLDFKKTYSVGLEYQPPLLDNSTSFFITYTSQRQAAESYSIMVGIAYFFDARVDIKTRDREYR